MIAWIVEAIQSLPPIAQYFAALGCLLIVSYASMGLVFAAIWAPELWRRWRGR